MYIKNKVLSEKRFTCLSELPDIITEAKFIYSGLVGKLRFEVRDNVVMVSVIRWSIELAIIDRSIVEAIKNKDSITKVLTDFECNWKYFMYTSIDDNLYGALEMERGIFELIDMSTGKNVSGLQFISPEYAIEHLL